MKIIEGVFSSSNAQIAVIISRFNSFVNESLLSGAVDVLKRYGQISEEKITAVYCPGAIELPLVAQKIAQVDQYDGIVSLGTVIRGGTPHFEYVCSECNSGLAKISLQYGIPIAFGVLTVDTIDQAIERAGTKAGNKGAEAALSLLEMIDVLSKINSL
ncbi:6,7-dimethyl-8-ribityllumazine synthase [Candidatus Photodesmus katoptron]|uniref:6,7-dimethyl-8-ribityllumazine synthase n=1 Tax=Candidatus Photodesmus katoptron Akat1 TaxID=1236703 RepID=S3DJP5_9GAMM|nr:6,7-dimethyl-8-ribityllumazine synthase [Candidatus Photodesmus katoptron]EPE37935.1 6,7-dimethyl-8-ribityllumazine synthase [Candidatus Photodesmus katoptron Akat1]KEY90278.1 6,7-dimethyl-8-ribityllumazine synthase [Candidatus Photodesmus katoptron]